MVCQTIVSTTETTIWKVGITVCIFVHSCKLLISQSKKDQCIRALPDSTSDSRQQPTFCCKWKRILFHLLLIPGDRRTNLQRLEVRTHSLLIKPSYKETKLIPNTFRVNGHFRKYYHAEYEHTSFHILATTGIEFTNCQVQKWILHFRIIPYCLRYQQ